MKTRWLILSLVILATAGHECAADRAGVTSLTNGSVRYVVPDKPYVVLKRGDVEAVIVDNRAVDDDVLPGHRAGYSGVASLKQKRQPRNVFVPAYAGLNFEHIHDGTTQDRDVLFEPRRVPMELRRIDEYTVELYQAPTKTWKLESCSRYRLLPDGVIELTFECIPRSKTFRNGYVGLFWASYINQPESLDIHFRGVGDTGDQREPMAKWVRGVTPAHGRLSTHLAFNDTRSFKHDADFPLSLVYNRSRHRYVEPWYYGVCRGMALVQVFRAGDGVRLTQSPSGGGGGNPAWDFQWFIPDYEVDKMYRLVMRAAYVPYTSQDDMAKLASAEMRKLAQ